MDSLANSFAEAIKRRTASAAIGSYLFFWAAYHWEGLYATFFTSQDLIFQQYHILKNEYVGKYFFGFHNDWYFYLGLVVPLVLTILFIWPLPKFVLIHAYRLEQKHKTARRTIKFYEDKKIKDLDIETVNQKTAAVVAATKLSTKERAAKKVDPTIIWSDEYEEFKKTRFYSSFDYLTNSIYKHSGNIRGYQFEIPREFLVYIDANGIVKLSTDKNKIDLTDKGRYYLKRFSADNASLAF
jgi:hypothetical protein